MSSPTGHVDPAHVRGSFPPMSPERVRSQEFHRTPLGRRGYDIEEVRRFLSRVAEDVAGADAEKARLRAEIHRLKNYFRERNVDIDRGSQGSGDPNGWPHAAAVNLMSRAQQAADAQVAQAEEYCRRLVWQATEQYEDILRHAAEEASQAADQARAAEQASVDVDSGQREALEQRVAWLRTFADVTRVQLRSVLEALTREVDKLDDLPHGAVPQDPRPAPGAVPGPPGTMPPGPQPSGATPQGPQPDAG